MKTYHKHLKAVNQNILIAIAILVTLFGMTLKANAQDLPLGNDLDKIKNSVIVQLANYEFDVLIPKINLEDLDTFTEATFNKLVYVVDGNSGSYYFKGSSWEKRKINEIFEIIDFNISIGQPESTSMIIIADEFNPTMVLDYNAHIKTLYNGFSLDGEANTMAINFKKEK